MSRQVSMLVILLAALIALASVPSFISGQSVTCGGAGYDVSAASTDMTVVSNGYTWSIHPCGSISSSYNSVCALTTTYPYGTMLCQQNVPVDTTSYNIAVYNSTVATSATWLAINGGVQYSVQDGAFCLIGAPRETTVQFICNSSATIPYFQSVTEIETCWYTAVIQTSAACASTGATASNSVGSSFYSSQCGAGIYDLSSTLNLDFYFKLGTVQYWVHPCGMITNTSCASAQPTSFCQLSPNSAAVDVSHWNASVPQIWSVTSTGLSVNVRDGAVCQAIGANAPRQMTIFFVCSPTVSSPVLSYVVETEICHYKAVITTSAVCSGSNAPANGYCSGAGYDMSALDTDLYYNAITTTGGGYQWLVHPCGVINPAITNACAGENSMLCQITVDNFWQSAAQWNSSVAASSVTWLAISNGVQYSVQDGDYCAVIGAFRETTVQFICDTSATTPIVQSINETETCWYTVVIRTTYACFAVGPINSRAVGSTYIDSICGGEIYDFTNIRNQGDLFFDSNTSSPTAGFSFYLNMCGQVQNSNCVNVQPSMFCQVGKPVSNGADSLAYVVSTTPVVYTRNANGITMSIQDGTPCGEIPFRQASIQIVCDGTTPAQLISVREVETCHYAATVRAQCNAGNTPTWTGSFSSSSSSSSAQIAVSSSQRVVPPVTFCGGAGYDVTAAAQIDLTVTTSAGQTVWWLRPCSAISTPSSACSGTQWGSMLCQLQTGSVYSASTYNLTTASRVQWLAINNGVQMSLQDGDMCFIGAPRETTVQFICNQTATTPYLASVVEIETCWYTAVVYTSSACQPTGATASNSVGSSFYSSVCGGGVTSGTAVATALNQDFIFPINGVNYVVHPCGVVTNSACAAAQPTSFCQVNQASGSIPVDASHWNASEPQIYTITSTGFSVNIRDGLACPAVGINVPRQATIEVVCNPGITTPVISYVSEPETCHYRAVIQSAAVCTGSNTPSLGYCGGAGYDLTALQNNDLYYNGVVNGAGFQWYLDPCGVVNPANTNACAGQNTMLCQISPNGQGWNSAAVWNASVAASGVAWTQLIGGNGVQYSVQDGDMCGSFPREVTVQFVCNVTASQAYVQSIREVETCWYTAVVQTIYACQQVSAAPHNVGSSFFSYQCGGGIYDFTNIRTGGDLFLDTNTSSLTSGYLYYIDLCGQVINAACSPAQPTMFCQVGKPISNGVNSLANVNASTPVLYAINSNGLTMSVQDGTPCGGVPFRQASIQIICDGTSPAQLISVRETETCHYAAVVRAQCNYINGVVTSSSSGVSSGIVPSSSSSGSVSAGVLPSSSSSGSVSVSVLPSSASGSAASTSSSSGAAPVPAGSSSSSSLSGGAIAGIVIGVFAGVTILIVVLAILCCGLAGFNRSKKNNEDHGASAGQFSEVHEQSQINESHDEHNGEVEMEETA